MASYPHVMFEDQGVVGVSDVLSTRRFRNERGLWFVQWNNIGQFTLELQVRPDANAAWATHIQVKERHMRGATDNYAEAIVHFPHVRAELVAVSAGAEVTVWYIE